jgi:hypothetical protein
MLRFLHWGLGLLHWGLRLLHRGLRLHSRRWSWDTVFITKMLRREIGKSSANVGNLLTCSRLVTDEKQRSHRLQG